MDLGVVAVRLIAPEGNDVSLLFDKSSTSNEVPMSESATTSES